MKRILEVCESYGGGVKRQLDYLDKYIDRSKYTLFFLVSSKRTGNIPNHYAVDDNLSKAIKNPVLFLKVLVRIHRLVKLHNIEVIHAHSTIAGLIIAVYKLIFRGSNVRVAYTPHAYFTEIARNPIEDRILVFIERQIIRSFFKVIHVSDEEEQYALRNKIVDYEKSVVIRNGVPIPKMQRVRHPHIVFVNVARCAFQKNPELFVEVAERVVKVDENVRFIWVGGGPLLEKCRQLVINKSLEKNISFLGYSDCPSYYLVRADVFISTSRYEGLPFSVIEAMSFGLPLLLTDVVGHGELVDNNGYLVDPKVMASEAFQKQIASVLLNRKSMSERSYDIFKRKYSISKMISGIEQVYDQVVI